MVSISNKIKVATAIFPIVVGWCWAESKLLAWVVSGLEKSWGVNLHFCFRNATSARGYTNYGTRNTRETRSPYARLQEKIFPVLQSFGIPIDDARVHKNIFRELFRISQICLQTSTMYLTLEDNKRLGFILVPKSSSLYQMQGNEKRFVWLDNILDALDEKTSRVELAKKHLMHIGSLEQ